MRRAIKCICILIIVVMMSAMVGSAFAEPDYYHIGLEVTDLMNEVVSNEAYLSLIGTSGDVEEMRKVVNTGDYDRPIAVYSISLDERMVQVLLQNMLMQDVKINEAYDGLSEKLKELLRSRISVQTVCSIVNGKMGVPYISFASISQIAMRSEALTDEKGACYLYVFEKGSPILVTFGYHAATAMFLFIPKEQQGSLNDIQAALQFLTVKSVQPAE